LYRNALSRRLLNKKSVSNDSERGFISKLKSQCGGPYTAKLEGMLNDFLLADEMNKEFEPSYVLWKGTQQRQLIPEGLSFDVQVLSSGHWPSQQHREALLPPELEACKMKFNEWYHTIHNHRTLKWMLNLGEGIVTAKIGDRTYDIQVTTLQTIILRIFDNTLESLSFTHIQQRAGITEVDVLKRLLHSLSCQKFKILLKSSSGKNVSPSDTFKVNFDFTSPLKKFRIPMAVLEDVEAVKTVQVERGTTIDAAIVRIMKSRKVINHNVLVGELLSQLCFFTPDPKAIKQRIESLIDREYMKRDLNDNKTYHYLP
jgi:cullin 1